MSFSAPEKSQSDALRLESDLAAAAGQLASIGRVFYQNRWVLGTSGNFSTVLSRDPFSLLITASGVHKGMMSSNDFLEVNRKGEPIAGLKRPSAETLIHLAILSRSTAGAILHTHSVWATILSDAYAASGGLSIHGYEMLKGLEGAMSHEHQEWLPILENSQDYPSLSREVLQTLEERPDIHGILLRGHGLYTWGNDIESAMRHAEVLEFLLEVIGRKHAAKSATTS
jgi:methylthioribulose-1-phosphate dehydratase